MSRFTVRPFKADDDRIGAFAILYSPEPKLQKDGTICQGLSFDVLIAGGCLGNQDLVLKQIADVLNASSIGRDTDTPPG